MKPNMQIQHITIFYEKMLLNILFCVEELLKLR